MNKAKFLIWWDENWLKWTLVIIVLIGLIGTIIGSIAFLTKVDSFQRNALLATIPLTLYMAILTSIIFVMGYKFFLMGGMSRLSSQKKLNAEFVNVKISDVIGLEEAKREAMEVVQLIRDHALIKRIGGKIIKGILMEGPPGCGKTLLAKAIASESNIPFLAISGSEFVEVFVGVGASRVRGLMKRARLLAEAHGACIVFIDELDVIGRARTFNAFGGSEETNSTQNELLVQMDGIQSGRDNIIFMGATNAAESTLDPALLRPGRFDRRIFVGRPHLKEREDVFRYYLGKVKADPSLDLRRLAQRTVFKSPAEIEAAVKESALIAARDQRETIIFKDLAMALERIDLGIAHRLPMTPHEKEMIAAHEAGHLITLYNQHPSQDVFKASILHRGGALGHVYPIPREERYTNTRPELIASIKVALAGFISERIKYGTTSTGACSDFANALSTATSMVWSYGMGTSGIIGDYTALLRGWRASTPEISNDFVSRMNDEAQAILKQCERETEELLRKEWPMVELFANLLIEKEELNYDEIEEIFTQHGKNRASFDLAPL